MSSKVNPESNTEPTKKTEKSGKFVCGVRAPGPKYLLKTLVGYQEHCLSKYRNPAHTFGIRRTRTHDCGGPGPKYMLTEPRHAGFSIGSTGRCIDIFRGPGPKYLLPTPKSPAFALKSRTKHRQCFPVPGPYSVKQVIPGPAFIIGKRTAVRKCDCVPAPHPYNDDLVRMKAPMFSLRYQLARKAICNSPGPKYYPKIPTPTPQYSFGTKHSECAPPYIVECDDLC